LNDKIGTQTKSTKNHDNHELIINQYKLASHKHHAGYIFLISYLWLRFSSTTEQLASLMHNPYQKQDIKVLKKFRWQLWSY